MSNIDQNTSAEGDDKGAEGPISVLPWERKPSIFEHIVAHVQSGELDEDGEDLPDEERVTEGSGIRWEAGAKDGIATHHMVGTEQDQATALLKLVVDYCGAPSSENKLKVYEQVVQNPIARVIDPFIKGLRQESGMDLYRFYDLAKSLVLDATDREPVKLGIAVLGLFRQETDKAIFRTLGRHDEFTLFCAVALANSEGDTEQELWELAKHVHGWGRIHVVERLAETADPQIKDWLLREGYKNSVMYEYLAYTCATGGGLLAALEKEDIDAELLASAGGIIKALLSLDGPAGNIDSYDDGAAVVEHYLKHLTAKASTIPQFLVVAAVRDFLADDEGNWEDRASRGWTPEVRSMLLDRCDGVMNSPLWRQLVQEELESSDDCIFGAANQAASILGIDTWECHWKRLQADPLELGRWFDAMQVCGNDHVAEVVACAERALPLETIATGPAKELGLGDEHEPHRCLGFILQGLREYPRHGERLIEVGLKSPVVSNRHMALRALAAWGKSNWPQGMEATLMEAVEHDPDEKVCEAAQKVIDGESLDCE